MAAFVLFATALGFGALARDAGFSLGHAAFLSLTMFALPNQVVLIDQLARGATIASAALAVTLAAVRLFPMVAATMPTLRGSKRRPVLEVLRGPFRRRDHLDRGHAAPAGGGARSATCPPSRHRRGRVRA